MTRGEIAHIQTEITYEIGWPMRVVFFLLSFTVCPEAVIAHEKIDLCLSSTFQLQVTEQ